VEFIVRVKNYKTVYRYTCDY